MPAKTRIDQMALLCWSTQLTDEGDGLWKELGQVLAPVIWDGDLLVPEVAFVFEHVGQVGRHVEDVLDVVLAEYIQVAGVLGTAQVQVGEDLRREGRLGARQRALIALRGAAQLPVRLAVRAVGADPEAAQAQDGGGRWGAGAGHVQQSLAVLWVLSLKWRKPP